MSASPPAPHSGPTPAPNPAPRTATKTGPVRAPSHFAQFRAHLPTLPQALASLMQTVVVALFVLTFIVQPLLIPSESMERTLLVGDFLLFNKQTYATPGLIGRWLLPYRSPARGDIVVFRHPDPPMLIKRVVGVPGDRLRIADGQVFINGVALNEPYATFEPAQADSGRDNFPGEIPPRLVDPEWRRQMWSLPSDGELTVPPGEYFVLGDNRNHSRDSRYWGFVPRDAFVGRPLVIYFSLVRTSPTDMEPTPQERTRRGPNDKLGLERELVAKVAAFARWRRILHVVH
ncbi:MAG TPA: signal peptidase I [Terracidiphilus sp.]|nr:signal peptidase I [Terracidiphilus sp.]